jgi:hypothetical protein
MDIKKNLDFDLYKRGLLKGFNAEQFEESQLGDSLKNEPLFYRVGLERGRKLFQEFQHLAKLLSEHYNSNS